MDGKEFLPATPPELCTGNPQVGSALLDLARIWKSLWFTPEHG